MRWELPLVLVLGLVGCATGDGTGRSENYPGTAVTASGKRTTPAPAKSPGLIVTPAVGSLGKIVSVNAEARYVVLTCPLGSVPAAERRLSLYRDGLKVGEIKITGPQRDTNTVADIVAGEGRIGDEVREN